MLAHALSGPAYWGTVADWFGGIATAAAVVVALWLAARDRRSRVRIDVSPGLPGPDGVISTVSVLVVNQGFTRLDVQLVVGLWGVAFPRDVLLGSMIGDRKSVDHGNYAAYSIDWRRFSTFEEHARRHRPFWRIERRLPRAVRIGAQLSTGERIYASAPHLMRWVRSRPPEHDPSLPPSW